MKPIWIRGLVSKETAVLHQWEVKTNVWFINRVDKGRTIRKVIGGGGDGEKTKKKFMQGKMPRKKIRAKKKGKKKNSCRRKVQL